MNNFRVFYTRLKDEIESSFDVNAKNPNEARKKTRVQVDDCEIKIRKVKCLS